MSHRRADALPAAVAAKARAAGAAWWLDALDGIVDRLCEQWSLTVGDPYAGATEAYVVPARLEGATRCVLKVTVPRPGLATRHEASVLRLCGGEGCARLLRCDEALDALLVERLGPSLSDLGLPIAQRHEVLCATASRVWRRVEGSGLPSGRDKAASLAAFIAQAYERLDRPCTRRAIDDALSCAERRGASHDDERAVLLHGDVHQWNALSSSQGFSLVDPDGLVAEAEYELSVLMREDPLELLEGDPRRRSRWLARRCGLNEVAIWEWGVVERVSTGLVCTEIDLQPFGRDMLAVADAVAA